MITGRWGAKVEGILHYFKPQEQKRICCGFLKAPSRIVHRFEESKAYWVGHVESQVR